MTLSRRRFHGALALGASTFIAPAWGQNPSDAQALHLLNRLAFGPAPGDLARVRQMGVDAYIAEQLAPERLPLPAALTERLDALPSTKLSQRELATQFREANQAARDEAGQAKRRELFQQMAYEAGLARLLRATTSPRQLHEVMVDFWFNHFNVFVGKGVTRVLVEAYEREAIRPHAMGRFRDLLGATARHPAMLFYLDNWLSAGPGYEPSRAARAAGLQVSGLNENYARELMELHTLGVDGGYTQHDVTELARIFTGWTYSPRARTGDTLFVFNPAQHDKGTKTWLGRRIEANGQAEGEAALDVLATHPATARHLGFKLAQYFVADTPPPALVDRLAQRFLESGGDITAVLKALFESPEFRAPTAQGAKFKTPYRYVVSSLRAAGQAVGEVRPLLTTLVQLGMPLYGCATPDGYKNTEEAWLNPNAMTRRIGFATTLAAGRQMGAEPLDAPALLATLGDGISARTRQTLERSPPDLRAALVLGGPDFMRH